MLGRGVGDRLRRTPPEEVWSQEVREICASCDLLVCNLECCVSDRGRRTDLVPGKPFFFRAPPAAIGSLQAIGTSAVSLANNHALDYGPDALEDTLRLLAEAGISSVGAGQGAAAARRGAVVEARGTSVGVLAVTDHPLEFAAREPDWGVAYADLRTGLPDWVRSELERLRNEADIVIAFPHWGPNMTATPARWQHSRARELLDAGAHAVVGHSAHVFHGAVLAGAAPVLFDLGDALDDYAVDPELRNDLGVFAIWSPGAEPLLELVGLRLEFCFTEPATGADADWIARRLHRACEELGTRVERLAEHRFTVGLG
jgi:poly-gamma-glutamate capsule biosynthesis protein CapA/YwtB (metallophosphatase superfamily)